ncbi:MAG: LCP family protein [Gaiellaceae bacterium]
MAPDEKPYRVYKGGRSKGKVPIASRPEPAARKTNAPRAAKPRRERRGWSKRRKVGLLLLLLLLLLVLAVVWGVASYLAFRGGVSAANARLDNRTRSALKGGDGLLLSHPTDILLLGTDHANTDARACDRHSDSIMLVRTDPSRHRITYLSIPRDLRVPIPGHGDDKINAAFQIGGAALAARTISAFTGLQVNHVVIVDFGSFETLIDKLGGVTIDVPGPILSNRFDCPYSTAARCQQWPGWRFHKGSQTMDGHRALIYSRIRENRLNASENDITRGARQQEVLQALSSKLASIGTLGRMPFIGGDLLRPLTTDLSAWKLLQLGWAKFRAGKTLHCRLGGSFSTIGGSSVIVSTEENFSVVRMVSGQSAPQPPLPGSGPAGPGCVSGKRGFR